LRDNVKVPIENLTKQQLLDKFGPHVARRKIAAGARRVFTKIIGAKICYECGYSKHVEICHIQSVASFSNCTKLYHINSIGNLVALCPNHHWEFDHGELEIEYPIYYGCE